MDIDLADTRLYAVTVRDPSTGRLITYSRCLPHDGREALEACVQRYGAALVSMVPV